MSLSPLELISEGNWRHVLFTTYSLSLSFFDSYLLRVALRKSPCREIWVVADIDGYNDSLTERQSRSVGQDYHLVPVALPHGVFHPKCVYLSGAEGDLLLIGSGNVTFGGYGRNIEVIEAFRSGEHPEIFRQFGEFLAALRARPNFINPDAGWINRFHGLAQAASIGQSSPSPEAAQLVHCVNLPVLDQLGLVCEQHGGASEARILSPYFDTKAEAVAKLVQELKSPNPVIGLISGQEARSGFPFGERGIPSVRSAVVDVERPRRRLHAKWIELDLSDGNRVTLTGSINATRQSLCSTNNIEVGVLRVEPAGQSSRLEWKTSKLPMTSAIGDYKPPGIGTRILLHARLGENGQLAGQLFGTMDVEGKWRGVLSRADGHAVDIDIAVGADGRFGTKLPDIALFDRATGLQFRIKRGPNDARCWVQNDWLIEVAQITRSPTSALLALLRGEASDQDESDFLTFLIESMAEFAPHLARVAKLSEWTETVARPSAAHEISVDELATREASTIPSARGVGEARALRVSQVLNRLIRQFEGSGEPSEIERPSSSTDRDDLSDEEAVADSDDAGKKEAPAKIEKSLIRFREVVKNHLGGSLGDPAKRALLGLWLVQELRMRLRGDDGLAEGRRFLREWLLTASGVARWGAYPDRLDDHMLLVLAILGVGEPADSPNLVGVHEALENYVADHHVTPQSVGAIPVPPLLARLLPSQANLVDALKQVMAARTRRQEIELVRIAVTKRIPVAENLALLSSGDGRLLQELLVVHQAVRLEEIKNGGTACPHCHLTLPAATLGAIRRLRFGRCVQCETFLFDTSPRE